MNLTIQLNGQETRLERVRTVEELLAYLGYRDKRIAVERNGDIVPKSLHDRTALSEGDRLEIVVAVGGG
jgi:sulfur carrier protein